MKSCVEFNIVYILGWFLFVILEQALFYFAVDFSSKGSPPHMILSYMGKDHPLLLPHRKNIQPSAKQLRDEGRRTKTGTAWIFIVHDKQLNSLHIIPLSQTSLTHLKHIIPVTTTGLCTLRQICFPLKSLLPKKNKSKFPNNCLFPLWKSLFLDLVSSI